MPLEIGNREQIELLQRASKGAEHKIPISVVTSETTIYNLSAKFTCPICKTINIERDSEDYEDFEPDDDDIKDFLENEFHSCSCGAEFEFVKNEDDDDDDGFYLEFIAQK